MTLEGKVALVTGGGRGIGRAYCLALLNEGTKVCICDLNEDTSTELIKNLPTNLQANIFFKKADVTDNNDFKDAFDKTIDRFGRIDIVVNNAGVAGENTWRKTIDVNFIGVLHGIKLGLQYLSLENGGLGGFIINTASVAGLSGCPVGPVYSATKYAVVGLTKSYGSDYHFNKTGVKVNAICPGAVDTALLRNFASSCVDEEEGIAVVKRQSYTELENIGQALIKVLKDNKNGSLLRIESAGMGYV
ncbi:15-hydroxyprostaglandin dehydrogenase [NAD(+)] isoform X1 [Parasteatoda tepidariorum]|uniref:15-hydroxyprostaglandin dehydrogenase [NAD(+)] isoform X1 n=1 Tax=Parasteatoda tepidariorum TaxID=114398 RepID=UPI001C71960B|nr:15-hydroxyprostaglandin dehydrogenase [NAD(+)] isoform X1 [Parasteatoda tepidariorum]